jgi:hypothetical protein
MYGIINKAIEELIIENFGEERWEAIKVSSGIDVDYFISLEPYDDDITFKLAGATAEVMNITLSEVLIAFGEWWILRTGKEKYGSLMESGGKSLRDFLIHLPNFHTRVMLMYPKQTPPEFEITHLEETSIQVHYHSKRQGLQEFVRGLLQGLSKLYKTETKIELLQSRNDGSHHEVFKVSWL